MLGFVGGGILCVWPLEGLWFGRRAFVLGLDERLEGLMTFYYMLLGGRGECGGLWMVGVKVGGIKGAVQVEVDATGASIIFAYVNEVEVFSRWGFHALLFVVCRGFELLLRPYGWDDGTWVMRFLTVFVVVFGRWSGGGLGLDEFACYTWKVHFNVVVDRGQVKS